ncbi:LamG-like jellyroll fold domain-containing protein, partial [Saccharicrinis sp. FJH2]|uniref:LamG-like jellyroll fold domain-containing protein n=1 Tax=Saccharicrinis sp. FJH65 TaxID=3344659 RepID=UPI0035F2E727
MKKLLLVTTIMTLLFTSILNSNAQNNCLSFDGADDYITMPTGIVDLTSAYTVEAWINVSDYSKVGTFRRRIIALRDANDNDLDLAVHENNNLTFVAEGTKKITSETYSSDKWLHIALVFNGTNYILYVNGIAQTISDGGVTTNNIGNSSYIGATLSSSGMTAFFSGQIDEVRIWNDERTESEIRQNMHKELTGAESNLVAYYPFNETSGITADNAEGTSLYDGTLTNMTGSEWTTSSAIFGPKNCLDFDGNNDCVDIPTLSPAFTQGTISFWIKPKAIPVTHSRVLSDAWDDDEIYLVNGVGKIATWYMINGDELMSSSALPVNEWTHVAITMDNSGSKLYINGVLDDESGPSDTDISTNFRIGGFYGAYWEVVNGQLDEFSIWSDVRTQEEIRENMYKNLTGNEDNLIAYYSFDNSSGTVLQDLSGNGNDGVLTNMDASTDWIASSAYNTWLNTSSSDWSTASNWSLGSVPVPSDNVGIYSYSGGANAVVSGSPTVNNLVLGSASSATLLSGLEVTNSLILESNLDLNGQTIILGNSGILIEDAGLLYGTSGTITTTRSLSNINENIGGLGAEISTSSNLGSTVITRGHAQQTGGIAGISRYYEITPTNNSGLNASLVFHYDDSELNSITEANLHLLRSTDGGKSWSDNKGTVNISSNTLTLSAIDAFSTWTAGLTSPTVTTSTATSVSYFSSLLGGNVTNNGGATVYERGIVYNTSGSPTTSDNKVQIGSGTGAFSQSVTGLLDGTTYYVRAYAINSEGTSYGGVESFTTSALHAPVFTAPTAAFDVSSAAYSGNSFNVISQLSSAYGIDFSSDGSVMFASTYDRKIVSYDLSSPWDITTAVYNTSLNLSYRSQGIAFNNDGTRFYHTGNSGAGISEYNLSTAYDLSSASFNARITPAEGSDYNDITFSNDGTKMYLLGYSSKAILEYTLSVAFDISTAVYTSNSYTVIESSNAMDLDFNADGSQMFVITIGGELIVYNLSTPFDLSTISFNSIGFDTGSEELNPYGLAFSSDGSYFYVIGATKKVHQYQINATVDFAENGTGTVANIDANDGDGGSTDTGITYSLTSGGDNDLFDIDSSTGALTFKTVPDFENPSDANTDNVYKITVIADDGSANNNTATLEISITVTNANDAPTASNVSTSSGPNQNQVYIFSTSDFGYSDVDSDPIDHIRITAIPGYGTLYVDANNNDAYDSGEELSNSSTVSKADLDAGNLQYYTTSYSGSTSFTFDVSDGTDYSTSVYTVTLSVVGIPTVTTSTAGSVSVTSATLSGEVTSDNNGTVSETGVVYSKTDNTPTIAEGETKVAISSGTGTFSQTVSSLSPATTYYFQAYAINPAGISYGEAKSLTTLKMDQTITFNTMSAKTFGDADFDPAATASSGLTVSYSSSDENVATIVEGKVHIAGVGSCTIYADQPGDANYNAATQVSQSLSVSKASASVGLSELTAVFDSLTHAAMATTTPSGLSVVITYNGGSVLPVNAGSYAVVATIDDESYNGSANGTLVISKASQSVSFDAMSAKTFGDADFDPAATASSGLAVSYSSSDESVATIVDGKVHIAGVGSCTIYADQLGDANYNAAIQVSQSLSVSKASASVGLSGLTAVFDSLTHAAVATTTPSGLSVVITYNGGSVLPVNAGSYAVVATIDDESYSGSANGTLVISKASQTISFDAMSAKTFGDADFDPAATASSGLAVSYSSSDENVATIVDGKVHITGVGSCSIYADQAGDANYNAATQVSQSLSVSEASAS